MHLSCQLFFESPHKSLKFQEKSEKERKSEEKSERVLEMHFTAIWRPKFQKFSLWCPPGAPHDREISK